MSSRRLALKGKGGQTSFLSYRPKQKHGVHSAAAYPEPAEDEYMAGEGAERKGRILPENGHWCLLAVADAILESGVVDQTTPPPFFLLESHRKLFCSYLSILSSVDIFSLALVGVVFIGFTVCLFLPVLPS